MFSFDFCFLVIDDPSSIIIPTVTMVATYATYTMAMKQSLTRK